MFIAFLITCFENLQIFTDEDVKKKYIGELHTYLGKQKSYSVLPVFSTYVLFNIHHSEQCRFSLKLFYYTIHALKLYKVIS